MQAYICIMSLCIHVIFSWAQMVRSAIFGRKIEVPDREIFLRQKQNKQNNFNVKICYVQHRRSLLNIYLPAYG